MRSYLVMDGAQFFLTDAEKGFIVGLHESGAKVSHIARRFNRSRETIYYWLKRYRENDLEGLKTLSRSGRPLEMTQVQDERIVAAGIASNSFFPDDNCLAFFPFFLTTFGIWLAR